MPHALKTSEKHYAAVDSLRGTAILLVLILHFHLAYRLTDGEWGDIFKNPILLRLIRNGNYGVVIFFVISGFLITSRTLIRFKNLQNINLRDFYIFRLARILPNILLMLSIVVALAAAGIPIFQNDSGGPSMFITVGSVLTFTHNLLMERFGYFNYCLNILWSLSVEEAFYLTFPFLCLLAYRKWIPLSVWTIFIFVGPLYRFSHRNDPEDIYALYDYFACFDGIAIGCLAAYFQQNNLVPHWLKKIAPFFLVGIALIYFSDGIWPNLVFGISGISILVGLFLLTLESRKANRQPAFPIRALQWIGRRSYELYLFHIIILALLKTMVKRADLNSMGKAFCFLAFLVLSSLVSDFIARYYSEPLNLRIRRNFKTAFNAV